MSQEPCQPPTKISSQNNLSKRLIAYATAAGAAGVGALALATPAEAKIVYTRVHKELPFGISMLDLNNDGIADFGFCVGEFTKAGDPPITTSSCLSTSAKRR